MLWLCLYLSAVCPPQVTVLSTRKKLIEVRPSALAFPTTFTLTYDLDLQSSVSYGHDLLACKSSKSAVSCFWKNKQTDGQRQLH